MSNTKFTVYWIHLSEHTDMFTEGYIGITSKSPLERFKGHIKATRQGFDYPLNRAIEKYGNKLIVQTILIGSKEYCCEIERKLRPEQRIGWNLAVGGDKPRLGQIFSEEALKKISAKMKNRNVSMLTRFKRGTPSTWLIADKIYNYFHTISTSRKKLRDFFNIKKGGEENIIKLLRSGWNPVEEPEWKIFVENYNKEAAINV